MSTKGSIYNLLQFQLLIQTNLKSQNSKSQTRQPTSCMPIQMLTQWVVTYLPSFPGSVKLAILWG